MLVDVVKVTTTVVILLFTLLECTYRVQSGILYGDYIQAPPWLIWQLSGFHPHPNFTPKPPVQQIATEAASIEVGQRKKSSAPKSKKTASSKHNKCVNDGWDPHNADRKFGIPRDTDEKICHMPFISEYRSYLKVFQEGLPKCNKGKKVKKRKNGCCMDIIVVGAGVSGLAAAGLLSKAGHNIKVLEASDRVGGRVQTYRDLANGWQAELGAMRIPKTHEFTLGYAKRHNLTLEKFNNAPWRYNMHERTLKPDYDLEDLNFFKNEFNIHPKDRHHKAAKIFMEALKKPNEDFECLSWKEIVKKYDKYSLRSWLTGKANMSADTVDYISVFYNIESFLDVGLVEILVDECVQVDPDFEYIRHGMDLLPRAMAENLNIQYNAKVTEIDQSGYKIRVKIDCKGVNCNDIDDHTFKADAIVMAIPAGPSASVEFKPKLSLQKTHALRTTPYSSSTKVVLAFEKPFWADQNGDTGGATLTDLPVKQIYYEMNTHKSGVGVVLASYTWGRDAQRHNGMSDDDLIDECVKSLAKIHNYSYDKVNKLLLKGVVKRWDMDENALGAFTMFNPFQYTQIDDDLRKSTGRIYFCGEHTESPHAWIDTAIKSGGQSSQGNHR